MTQVEGVKGKPAMTQGGGGISLMQKVEGIVGGFGRSWAALNLSKDAFLKKRLLEKEPEDERKPSEGQGEEKPAQGSSNAGEQKPDVEIPKEQTLGSGAGSLRKGGKDAL